MPSNQRTQISGTTRKRSTVPDSIQTTNATQATAFSFVLPEGTAIYVRVAAVVVSDTVSNAGYIVEEAVFRRPVGGNITRSTGVGGATLPLIRALNDFTGGAPTMDIVANTSTQSVEIKVTGKASTTLNWYFERQTLRKL